MPPADRRGGLSGRTGRALALGSISAVALAIASPAAAQEVRVSGEAYPQYGRLIFTWPESYVTANLVPETAEVENGVLVARFPSALPINTELLRAALPERVALARFDEDGRTLRIALVGDARAHISQSYNVLAIDFVNLLAPDPPDVVSPEEDRLRREAEEAAARAAAEVARATAPPPALPLNLRIAESADFARIVFDWTEPTNFDLVRTDEGVEVRFERDAVPDLVRLRVDPPKGVVTAEARHDQNRLQVPIALQPGMTARAWSDGVRVIVDVLREDAAVDSVAALEAMAVALRQGETPQESLDATQAEAAPPPGLDNGAEPEGELDEEAAEILVAEAASEEGAAEGANAAAAESSDGAGAAAPLEPAEEEEPLLPPVEDLPLPHTRAFEESGRVEELTRDPYEGVEIVMEPEVADPVPASGGVRATVVSSGAEALVTFTWAAPVGAAAFQRGDSVWLVFDAEAALDVQELVRAGVRHLQSVRAVTGDGYSAVRVTTPAATQVSVVADGAAWTFAFGESATPPRPAGIERRADDNTRPHLFASLPTVTQVHEVRDEEAGDVLLVATALGPPQGLPSRRTFLEIAALPSAHGLGFERAADGVAAVAVPGEGVVIERDRGLALSGGAPQAVIEAAAEAVAPKPGFIDFAGWSADPVEFAAEHDALTRRIATGDAPASDRLALARLLVGQELGLEAIGVLRIALQEEPLLLEDPRFRALRGAANVLAGRYREAENDLNAQPLAGDAGAAPWRGYVATRFRDWREARRQFADGAEEMDKMRPDWRGRFLVAAAESALQLNDLAGARLLIDEAYSADLPPEIYESARLTEARFFAQSGDAARALDIAGAVATSGHEQLEASALFEVARLRHATGQTSAAQAIDELDALRFRWRGDEIEIEIVRTLGAMYLEAGELRQGMQLMKTAASRFSDNPLARQVYTDMSGAFRRLFLDGESDQLDPIEALALWYEFNDLTPIGPDGDRMLRRLADRLIDFDLLEQAAELLAHQVDNRLRGVARAQVATDLAAVYLMDKRPEEALNALRRTRIAGSPTTLVNERRLLEARALADVDRFDHALELLETDRSPEAMALRADIGWEARMWPRAAEWLEAVAGDSWRGTEPLTSDMQSRVLRAAVANRLASNDAAVQRLVGRFGPKMSDGPHSASWRTVTGEVEVDGVVLRDLAGRIAETATLDAFLDEFRTRRSIQAEADALAMESAALSNSELNEGELPPGAAL